MKMQKGIVTALADKNAATACDTQMLVPVKVEEDVV